MAPDISCTPQNPTTPLSTIPQPMQPVCLYATATEKFPSQMLWRVATIALLMAKLQPCALRQ